MVYSLDFITCNLQQNAWECGYEIMLVAENVTVHQTFTNIVILHSVHSIFVIIDRNIWYDHISNGISKHKTT